MGDLRRQIVLPCITVTDTGVLNGTQAATTIRSGDRGYMRDCHHQDCDDKTFLNEHNMQFLAQNTELVWRTVEDLSQGDCMPEDVGADEEEEQMKPFSSSCNNALLKRERSGTETMATCRFEDGVLELCPPPVEDEHLWGNINSPFYWSPDNAKGDKKMKKLFGRSHWYQVRFNRPTNITSIEIQSVPKVGLVKSYMISYGDNGLTWNWYIPQSQQGRPQIPAVQKMTGPRSTAQHLLQPSIVARFIRIHPQKWKKRIAMRIQMYGCTRIKKTHH